MKKNKGLFITLICFLFLTGCGSKTCAKWETTSAQLEDCSKYDKNQKIYCERKNANQKQTQTCVEWVD